jgi:hypothetical protein
MKRVLTSFAAALAAILVAPAFFHGAAFGQSAYSLGIDGPDSLSGSSGDTVNADYSSTLGQTGGVADGAQGWSLSIAVDGALITDITTTGTAVDALFVGGFNKTEVVDPAKNAGQNGAVSAIVLSFTQNRQLPVNATSPIAKLKLACAIVAGGSAANIHYVDGLRGSGQPVQNAVTELGNTVTPTLGRKDIQCKELVTCCKDGLNVGFTDHKVSSSTAYDGIADASGQCASTGGELVLPTAAGATGQGHVFASISSQNQTDGVQGWSFSIAMDGDIKFTGPDSVTTAGTAVDALFAGGFNKTEIIDPAKNSGKNGAVSAIVLSFTQDRHLKTTGTESVLDLGISANGPQGEADIVGSLTFLDDLRGSGQPVKNALTVAGNTADNVCNLTTPATAQVVFRLQAGPPGFQFVRGNPNGDTKINIADAVWIINELFRSGPASSCPASSDINGDGVEDAADALYLATYLFRGGPSPPSPFPGCALDPVDPTKCPAAQDACP